MPIYEYVCEACGRITEVMQRVSDPPPPTCAECGERRLARLVSRTSFQLRGGGWYSDLYASPKQKPEAGSGASASASPGGDAAAGGPPSSGGGDGAAKATGSAAEKPAGSGAKGSGEGSSGGSKDGGAS